MKIGELVEYKSVLEDMDLTTNRYFANVIDIKDCKVELKFNCKFMKNGAIEKLSSIGWLPIERVYNLI
jgi:hypothetical protein